MWVAGGAAVLALLAWLAFSVGLVANPWFIVVTGAIGAVAGAVAVTVMARRR